MTGRSLRAAITSVMAAVCVCGLFSVAFGDGAPVTTRIGGPYGQLISASTDLGAAHGQQIRVTAELNAAARPSGFTDWAVAQGLSVNWRDGDRWAVLQGPAQAAAHALDIDIRTYRGGQGQVFYASPQQPAVPADAHTEVAGLGRVLGYTPFREAQRWMLPLEVPGRGLTPDALMRTYNIDTLHNEGFTGKGTTVVVFAFDGFDQADLD